MSGEIIIDPANGPYRTISEGLKQAKPGNFIKIQKGTYMENI